MPETTELSRALNDLEQQRRRTKADLAARKEASDDFDRNYLSIGRVAEALLRMAGKHAEADHIHPSTRQLDRKSDEEEMAEHGGPRRRSRLADGGEARLVGATLLALAERSP